MDDIKRVRLGDIAELITKGTTPTTLGYDFQDEGINFLKIECFDENGSFLPEKVAFISEECNEKLKRSQLKEGDVLFSIAGAIGRVAIVTEEMLPANTNQALAIIRITDENVYLPYIKLILTSPIVKKQFEKKKQGVAQLNLSLKDINEIVIPLPDKKRQIEYAELFGKLYGVITLRNTQLSDMDNLIKARFVEIFGHPGKNEKGWKMNTFGDICTVRQGLQIPISKRLTEYEEGCYEYITVQYLHGGKEREYIKNPKETVICNKDDILMTRTGNTGMVITGVDGVFHNNFFLIDFDRSKYDKDFLVQYLNLDMIQADILRRAGTSTIPDLNHGEFYKIQVFEPPMALQVKFNYVLKQVDKSKVAVKKALDETQTLFDSLMQEYFG